MLDIPIQKTGTIGDFYPGNYEKQRGWITDSSNSNIIYKFYDWGILTTGLKSGDTVTFNVRNDNEAYNVQRV